MKTNIYENERSLRYGAAVALVAAGFLPAPGADSAFYILLPYATALVCCVASIMEGHGLTFRRQKPDEAPTHGDRNAARLSIVGCVASALAAIGMLLHSVMAPTATFGYVTAAESPAAGAFWARAGYFLLLSLAALLLYLSIGGGRKAPHA